MRFGKLLSAMQLGPTPHIRNRCMAQCPINLHSHLRDSGIGGTTSYDKPTSLPHIVVADPVTPDYRCNFRGNHVRGSIIV